MAHPPPHLRQVVVTEAVLRVFGLVLYSKDAVESHPSIGEGRAAVLVVPARARVPDMVKISGAF